MSSLLIRTEQSAKKEYNSIPVHYCRNCLSLRVMRVPGMDNVSYCDDCGCTDTAQINIEEWETLYKARHGFTYLNNSY